MNLDHLDRLAAAAGYAAVPDDDDVAVATLRPARVRFATPDAPAPRRAVAAPGSLSAPVTTVSFIPPSQASATAAVTMYVSTALRTAQSFVGTRRVTA